MSAAPQLIFNEAEHTYTVDGVRWPSVTQVLDPLLELDGIPRETLRAAAEFGTHVHQACHLWDIGRLDEPDLDEALRPYLEGWKKFLRDTGAEVLESERRVLHPVLKAAGTLDKVIRMPTRRERHILDIKSGSTLPWTVGMQTAAYREMLWHEELSLQASQRDTRLSNTRFCCQLLPDATYRLETLKETTNLNDFISCLNVHNLRKRHGRRQSR